MSLRKLTFVIFCVNFLHANCCFVRTFNNVNTQLADFLEEIDSNIKIDDNDWLQELAEENKTINKEEDTLILYKGAVSNLPDVTIIKLNKCGIRQINNNAFVNLPQLGSLYLNDNEIEEIDIYAFKDLPITSLILSKNRLKFLAVGIFASLKNVQSLFLDHNAIEYFNADWFNDQPKLIELNMVNNNVCVLKRETFTKFKNLKTLNFRGNRIQYVHEDAFIGLNNLKYLDLSFNRIARLERNVFKPLKRMQELWLFANNITYISQKTLKDINSVERITIHTNPWQCACFDEIMRWSQRNPVSVVSGLKCFSGRNPVCVVPSTDPDKCLDDRDEDLDKHYYDSYNLEKDLC